MAEFAELKKDNGPRAALSYMYARINYREKEAAIQAEELQERACIRAFFYNFQFDFCSAATYHSKLYCGGF